MITKILGALLGFVAGSVLRIRREHVEASMERAGVARAEAAAMYRELGKSAIEFLAMAFGLRAPAARIDARSERAWHGAIAEGRGVVIAASHTGNWDLAACAMAQRTNLTVVTKRLSVRWLDRLWQSTRARLGVKLVEARGAVAHAKAALAQGGAVAMMIDQVPASVHGVEVEFLGQRALADRAPAALAAQARAPLVVAAAERDASGAHVLHVLEVLWPPRRATTGWIAHATREATRALDGFVRAHPSQWLWLHRRWRYAPAPCEDQSSPSPDARSRAA